MNNFFNLFNYLFGFMLRNHERSGKLTGATWLIIGCAITVIFYDKPIAISAMLFLTIGDSIAAIIGKIYPLYRVGQKTLSGAFCGFFSSFIIVVIFNQTLSPIVILFGAIIAMFSELITTRINDNLMIPVFSGFAMMLFDKTI
ncbi:MAG: diacylglycerol/polyprenol kinase family protein [Candidatus Neomarinimicrobiota bacterium]